MKYFLWVILFLIIWAFVIEPNIITVTKLKLRDENLKGLRVVFASDFHIKPYETLRLKRIVNKINKQKPDIVLLGGDYVNGHRGDFTLSAEDIATELSKLKSHYGSYAVLGNHDVWQARDRIIKALESNGITVLENRNVNLDRFTVAGLEDLKTAHPDVKEALEGARKPVLMLTHSPDTFPDMPKQVTFAFAGHLHGGQVRLPDGRALVVPSKYGQKYLYGLKSEDDGKRLFISRGLGTSILALRFNCPPEIVVIDFH